MVFTRSKANAAPLEVIKVETTVPAVRSALGDVTNVNRSPTDKNGFGLPVPVAGKKGNHSSRQCALLKRRGHYIFRVLVHAALAVRLQEKLNSPENVGQREHTHFDDEGNVVTVEVKTFPVGATSEVRPLLN